MPIRKNTLVEIGKEVAWVLAKENPESFTGHCWHRSSATPAAHNGASTVQLKTHYDWAQDSMVKEYVDHNRASTWQMAHFLQTTTDTEIPKNAPTTSTDKTNNYLESDRVRITISR